MTSTATSSRRTNEDDYGADGVIDFHSTILSTYDEKDNLVAYTVEKRFRRGTASSTPAPSVHTPTTRGATP